MVVRPRRLCGWRTPPARAWDKAKGGPQTSGYRSKAVGSRSMMPSRKPWHRPALRLDDGQHRFYCGAGLAGTEVTSACDQFLNAPHPFARLILKSDGYTSCLGAHGGRDGALIAIGTGTVAFQIEGDKEYKVGGWGFPHGDEGSGAWLGLEAVRLTLHWLDGRGEPFAAPGVRVCPLRQRSDATGDLGQPGQRHPVCSDCALGHRPCEATDSARL